jgi:hypothetical protein
MKAPILCSCEDGIECAYHKQERLAGKEDFEPTGRAHAFIVNSLAVEDPTNPANWSWFGQTGEEITQ